MIAILLLVQQEVVDRLEKRVEALRDLECEYSTSLDYEDDESRTMRFRARVALVRGRALRVEGHRWQTSDDEAATPPVTFRYLATPGSYLCELESLEPRLNRDGLPIARVRYRVDAGHPSLARFDPFLLPVELPARVIFDAPVLLANIAPKLFFTYEPDLRAEGKFLIAERSLEELLRIRGKGRGGIAASRRRYEIDDAGRVVRCDLRLSMADAGDVSPLIAWTVVKWQDAKGVSIPAEIEVAFGGVTRDGKESFDRRWRKVVGSVRANEGLTIAEDRDVAAPVLLRKDARGLYARLLSKLYANTPVSGGLTGSMDSEELALELERALELQPESPALRSSLLLATTDPDVIEKLGPGATDDVKAWLLLQDPESKFEIDPSKLSEHGRDLWAVARMQGGGGVEFLREELKTRTFQRRLELVTHLARWNPNLLKKEIPLCAVFLDHPAALADVAEDPDAAGFVLHAAHEIIEHGEADELEEAAPALIAAIQKAGTGRPDDPLVPTLLGELAAGIGKNADAAFAEALKRAESTDRAGSAYRATMEAAAHYAKDEKKLLEIFELFLRLTKKFGRPGLDVYRDKKAPVVLLARCLAEERKFAELYRCLRRIEWTTALQFSGVQAVLPREEFAAAALEECRKGKDAAEHAALSKLFRISLGDLNSALALLKEARALAPKDPELVRQYAEVATHAKQPDVAIQAYRDLAALGYPEDAALSIAGIELARKNEDAAKKAVADLRFDADPGIAERAGAIFYRLKEYKRAWTAYLAAEQKGRVHNLAVGRVHQELGDFEEAMRRFNRAVDAGENDPGQRVIDPRAPTAAEKAKAKLYERIGRDYFLERFWKGPFDPLPKEKQDRIAELLQRLDDDALDEIEAMGPNAAPFLKKVDDQDGVRRVLLRWAEPR